MVWSPDTQHAYSSSLYMDAEDLARGSIRKGIWDREFSPPGCGMWERRRSIDVDGCRGLCNVNECASLSVNRMNVGPWWFNPRILFQSILSQVFACLNHIHSRRCAQGAFFTAFIRLRMLETCLLQVEWLKLRMIIYTVTFAFFALDMPRSCGNMSASDFGDCAMDMGEISGCCSLECSRFLHQVMEEFSLEIACKKCFERLKLHEQLIYHMWWLYRLIKIAGRKLRVLFVHCHRSKRLIYCEDGLVILNLSLPFGPCLVQLYSFCLQMQGSLSAALRWEQGGCILFDGMLIANSSASCFEGIEEVN